MKPLVSEHVGNTWRRVSGQSERKTEKGERKNQQFGAWKYENICVPEGKGKNSFLGSGVRSEDVVGVLWIGVDLGEAGCRV